MGRVNVLKMRERKKIQEFHFFLLHCDRLVLNVCQKSSSDEIIFEGFVVILDKALCYNNVFPEFL